ncbi:oxidoreductase [Apiospora hydei]|uniref:Oxidoreductase n=1 Tax=Apiospora hydei TaxID=1337664 RepID=A0ABR1V3M2_9PEZI
MPDSQLTAGQKKKYAIVGTGGRAIFYYTAIAQEFSATSVISLGHGSVPTYPAAKFDQMIRDTKPNEVIVTTIDRTHHLYIIRALELGCNVVTEKPMTIDAPRCREILDAVERTEARGGGGGGQGAEYAPHNTKVFELLRSGVIGTVTSIHFEWMLNTSHGRGLLVHKSTHHFDLVNFWLQTRPATVYAQGDLKFYGRENAERRGAATAFYARARGSEAAREDPFALHMEDHEQLRALYLDAEHEDAYYRDQSVFSDGISIEDTMNLLVRYRNGAVMTYSLTAYAPWEGFRVSFNGTGGRLELEVVENSYVNSGGDQAAEGNIEKTTLLLRPLFEKPLEVEIPAGVGAHGGGDTVLLNDLFGVPTTDDCMRAASHIDGALSILTGIAANRSIATGQVVHVDDVLRIP